MKLRTVLFTLFIYCALIAFGQTITNGLVGYYPFNGNANDMSGHGNHGELCGGSSVPSLTTDRFGNANSAYDFGGMSSYNWIKVPNSESLMFDKEMTLTFWMQLRDFVGMDGYGNTSKTSPGFAAICKAGDGNATYPGLFIMTGRGENGEGIGVNTNNSNGNSHSSSNWNHSMVATKKDFVLGDWLHVALVVSDYNKYLYINGMEVCRDALNVAANFSSMNSHDLYFGIMASSNMTLGRYGSGAWYPFYGKLDDIQVYNRALSSSEVSSIFKSECVPVKSLALSEKSVTLSEGEQKPITVTVLPANATSTNVKWSSDDYSVATVVDNKIVAVKGGTAKITATSTDGSNVVAECFVKVNKIDDEKKIEITNRYKVHWASDQSLPSMQIRYDNGERICFRYSNHNYEKENGVYVLMGNKDNDTKYGKVKLCTAKSDEWVYQKIMIYKGKTLLYYQNGVLEKAVDLSLMDLAKCKSFQLDFSPYGWYTGHTLYVDDLTVKTNSDYFYDFFDEGLSSAKWSCNGYGRFQTDPVNTWSHYLALKQAETDRDYSISTCPIGTGRTPGVINAYAYKGFAGMFGTSQVVEGVTADGISQFFLESAFVPQGVELTAYTADMKPLSIKKDEMCEVVKYAFSPVMKKSGYVIRSPKNFPASLAKDYLYILKIKIKNAYGLGEDLEKEITVYRTGVLLVHGLNSDGGCFRKYEKHLWEENIYNSMLTHRVDYSKTSIESFYENSHEYRVIYNNMNYLYGSLLKRKILSSAYDLVGHSMGGILSRIYVQEFDDLNKPEHVHKIITVNTPHFGSQGACDLVEVEMQSWKWVKGNYLATGQAVQDLKTGSKAIQQLSDFCAKTKNIPCFSVCSYLGDDVPVGSATSESHNANAGARSTVGLPSYFKPVSFESANVSVQQFSIKKGANDNSWLLNKIFDDKCDGVVALESQIGGLDKYTTRYSEWTFGTGMFFSPAHHTNTTEWSETWSILDKRLTERTDGGTFSFNGYGKLPDGYGQAKERETETASVRQRGAKVEAKSSDSYVKIEAKVACVSDSVYVQVGLNTSSDIVRNLVMATISDGSYLVSNDCDKPEFLVPDDYSGELKFFALGRNDNDVVVVDSVIVNIPSRWSVESISLNESMLVLNIGQKTPVSATAVWNNGMTTTVYPKIVSSDSDIATVEEGIVTAISAGECYLSASYNGAEASALMSVNMVDAMQKGDLDNSCHIDSADMETFIKLYLEGVYSDAGDMDDNSIMDVEDAVRIIDLYVKGEKK